MWNVGHREGDAILIGDIRIDAAIVLGFRGGGRARGYKVRNVGHAIQTAANTGGGGTYPAEILRTQGGLQRRTDIQALAWNRSAIYPFRQARSGAGGRIDSLANDTGTREGEILRGDASSRRGGSERRCFIPSVADTAGVGFASSLIVKEEEDLILPDRAADVAGELIKPVIVSQNAIA